MVTLQHENVVCRAHLTSKCHQGRLYSHPGSHVDGSGMAVDGTYKNGSIVCDDCYVRLMPYSPSGKGLLNELDDAIVAYYKLTPTD